ncbi:MAG: bifunctional oligoribonuclease/PAP phosphatase NrnA [Sphingobacteriales bacterium]|nr:MAG: bifunctional oligoribonuclease/PAP phosphatase NrnA [Sphingobacteriales bacterium]
MKPLQELFPFLTQQPRRVVVTMHQKPDPDAMGSSLGLAHFLRKLGHEVTVISPTNWADFLKWMPGCKQVIDYEAAKERADAVLDQAEWLFCLDFNTFSRTRHMAAKLQSMSCVKVLVDHHEEPQTAAFTYGISVIPMSSTAELIYQFIVDSGHGNLIDIATAECLYAGVMADTGSFRFSVTSSSVHEMVAHLKKTGFDHSRVHEQIYDNFLENRLRFIGHVLSNRMEVLYEYNTAIIAVPKSDILKYNIRTGDTEGLVNYPLSILGIKLAALVIDRDEERKWSFRSKGDFDCNSFARKYFEGGGHFNAAGGRSSEGVDENVRKFKLALKETASQLQ